MDTKIILTFVVASTIGWLARRYLGSYAKKKGENLAAKEDIGEITHAAELSERLIASLAEGVSPEISVQLAEVRRRIAQVESGEAALIPGDEVLSRARRLLAEHSPSS